LLTSLAVLLTSLPPPLAVVRELAESDARDWTGSW
jgi:hypothetical protein